MLYGEMKITQTKNIFCIFQEICSNQSKCDFLPPVCGPTNYSIYFVMYAIYYRGSIHQLLQHIATYMFMR